MSDRSFKTTHSGDVGLKCRADGIAATACLYRTYRYLLCRAVTYAVVVGAVNHVAYYVFDWFIRFFFVIHFSLLLLPIFLSISGAGADYPHLKHFCRELGFGRERSFMSIFAIADTHLSESVSKPMDIFGYRWKNWTEKLTESWKKSVTEKDTVVIPGDISWGMSMEEAREDLLLLDSLPGRKIIGKGNHDYWWGTVSKIGDFFDKNGIKSIDVLFNNAFLVEDTVIAGCRGWYSDEKNAPDNSDYEKIVAREVGRLKMSLTAAEKLSDSARKLVFFHFPPVLNDFLCREIVDTLKEYDVTECFFGHIHGRYDLPPSLEFEGIRFTMVSADYLDFVPLKLN